MNIMKFIPDYEELKGEKLHPDVVRLIEKLDEVGKQLASRGREDANQNRSAVPDDAFKIWCQEIFGDDPETVDAMAYLMQAYYMDGYQAGGAA